MVGDVEPEAQAVSVTKRAEGVLRELERDIMVQGLSPGHKIGEESQLARRFGLSRSVAREAIAIGEWEGFLENRRGRHGGLYVAAPSAEIAVYAVRNYLFLSGASLDEIIHCRDLLERPLLELAMRRARPQQIDHLATLLEGPGGDVDSRLYIGQLKAFVDELSQAADMPPLTIFSAALRHCYVDRTRVSALDDAGYRRVAVKVVHIRQRQVEAVISLDFAAALALHMEAMALWRAFHAHPRVRTGSEVEMIQRLVQPDPATPIYEFVRQVKKTEAIARVISQRISDAGLKAGDRLGTEAELMQQLQAGRGALREAIRILERYGVVEPARGKRGGLTVGEPKIEALLRVTQRFLSAGYAREPDAYLSLTRLLMREAARNGATRLGRLTGEAETSGRPRFEGPSIDFFSPPSSQMKQLGQAMANLCQDRALRCFLRIMIELVCKRPDGTEWSGFGEAMAPDMACLFESIGRGDMIWAPRQSDRLFEHMWPIDPSSPY